MDRPDFVKILGSKKVGSNIKTIKLEKRLDARAGQFVMLWIPGLNEKPFSLSGFGKDIEITFDVKGRFTERLAKMQRGDMVGVRGPYGNGWDIKGERIAVVAGGVGLAPMMPLIEAGRIKTVIYGARNRSLLAFKKRLERTSADVVYTTDDGSFGKHCYACDALEGILSDGYDLVLTCGPEIMMKKVVSICARNNILCQASLERYMKCGIGLCGSCVFGPGLRVCRDGPVFTGKQLEDTEFGSGSTHSRA